MRQYLGWVRSDNHVAFPDFRFETNIHIPGVTTFRRNHIGHTPVVINLLSMSRDVTNRNLILF